MRTLLARSNTLFNRLSEHMCRSSRLTRPIHRCDPVLQLQLILINRHCSTMAAGFQALKSEFSRLGGGGEVKLDKDDQTGIAVITLHHQEHRNAITGTMVGQLADAVADLEEWVSGKGLILWGGGENFCSGADLQQIREVGWSPSFGHNMAVVMHNILTRLHQLPLVSVALVSGKAIGGGAEITTACDFRLMATGSEVQFVQARMGVVPGWGGGTRLVRLLGGVAALDLLLTSRRLNVQDALALGFANGQVSAGDGMLEEAKQWIGQKTRAATEVVRAMKQITVQAQMLPLGQSLEFERQAFAGLWAGEAQQKALGENIKHR